VQSKTPLLGDIPLLGHLFRYETRQRTKTNLMVFIRPYIMYQENGYQKLTADRYEQMNKKREDARLSNHWFLPNDDSEKLPELKAKELPAASAPAATSPGPDAASAPVAATSSSAAGAPAAASTADLFAQP
jgi:general secretion pathway protein D